MNTIASPPNPFTLSPLNPDKRDSVANVLYCAALLSGTPVDKATLLDNLELLNKSKEGRTCIDAGSPVMFSVLAPGERSLRVLMREEGDDENSTCWRRLYYYSDGKVEFWRTRMFTREKAAAWEHACSAANLVNGEQRLKQYQAVLGPRGRIYCVASSDTEATVSWKLDHAYPPDIALANAGLERDWQVAMETLRVLLGQYPSSRVGPWSITRYLHQDSPLVRIGTTGWARQIEDEAKRQRLATLFDQIGGDGRFAEGLYKLISSVSEPNARIGRAIEVELVEGHVTAVECFLSIPEVKNHQTLLDTRRNES